MDKFWVFLSTLICPVVTFVEEQGSYLSFPEFSGFPVQTINNELRHRFFCAAFTITTYLRVLFYFLFIMEALIVL
jgi:hypothetical protein